MKSPASRRRYPAWLRRVVALVEVDGQWRQMEFLSDNLEWSAQTIVDLYRCRWEIEVFFKEIKQTLQLVIPALLGTTGRACARHFGWPWTSPSSPSGATIAKDHPSSSSTTPSESVCACRSATLAARYHHLRTPVSPERWLQNEGVLLLGDEPLFHSSIELINQAIITHLACLIFRQRESAARPTWFPLNHLHGFVVTS